MFVVASAAAFEGGAPSWLAFGVGLLAFPAIPGSWHLIAELRRRKPAGGVTMLTGFGRAVLRTAVVAVVLTIAVVAVGRERVWRAVREHWMGWSSTSPLGDPALVSRVPRAAEALLWVSGTRLRELAPTLTDYDGALDAVAAWDSRDGMIATRGNPDPVRAIADVLGWPWDDDELVAVPSTSPLRVWLSPAWKATLRGGPAPALARLLDRVPGDVVVAIVARPAALIGAAGPDRSRESEAFQWLWKRGVFFGGALAPEDARTITGWIHRSGDDVTARIELEAIDEAAAARLDAGLHEFADGWSRMDRCRGRASTAASGFVHRDGTTVSAVVRMRLDVVRALTLCAFGRLVK